MATKRSPENTSFLSPVMAADILANAFAFGGPAAIKIQEVRGQSTFVTSDTLPKEMNAETRRVLEAAGVKFVGPVHGDSLFQFVELPKGWRKDATDHTMWSKLCDDKGRERASIFYKAAYYDRRTSLSLTRRYNVRTDYEAAKKTSKMAAQVLDGVTVIHTTAPVPIVTGKQYEASQEAEQRAVVWLDEHYSEWRDYTAYWD